MIDAKLMFLFFADRLCFYILYEDTSAILTVHKESILHFLSYKMSNLSTLYN